MRAKQAQSGFALLFYLVVVIGFLTAGLSGLLGSSIKQKNEQDRIDNIRVLKQAKEGLLAYGLQYVVENKIENMGRLPCPDIMGGANNNGNSDPVCDTKGDNSIGYYPYKTVGLGKIQDSSNECLWYVVSGNYKNNPDYDMLNWDSTGFLNIEDESGNLQHGAGAEDFPVALIISPGKSLGQDRTEVSDLSDCSANYTIANYLEDGPGLDYTSYFPVVAETLWTFLTASFSSTLAESDYNDQIVAIYKHELWERVKSTKDLDTSVTGSQIQLLTAGLAQCLANYANDTIGSNNPERNMPFPADVKLTDYSDETLYLDNDGAKLYGRFTQNISDSDATINVVANDAQFVRDGAGTSYCAAAGVDEKLWKNWKDHFFYVLANDYIPDSGVPLGSKCATTGNCLSINTKTAAAIVFFAQEKSTGQDRTLTGLTTDQEIWDQYLDGANQTLYLGTDATNDFSIAENDYAYCVIKTGSDLTVEEC